MKGFALFPLLVTALAAPQAKAEEVGKFVYQYEAGTYRVQTLRYGPADSNQLLIRIHGIDNDQDGRIYLHTKKCDDTRCKAYKYVTTQVHKPDGNQWFTIYNSGGYGGDIVQPYLVESDEKLYLGRKTETDLDPDFFLASYKRQQAGG